MDDLVEKFYATDLTGEEEEALDRLLDSSPEAAERFARLAAEAYGRSGQPDPGAGGDDLASGPTAMRILLFFGGLFLVAAFGIWHVLRTGPAPAEGIPSNTSVVSPTQHLGDSNSIPEGNVSVPAENGKTPATNLRTPVLPGSSNPKSVAAHSDATPSKTHLSTDDATDPGHRNLKVTLELTEAAPVTIRVLDPQGQEVKSLYRGQLQTGKASFTWNGRLANGRKAPPGTYRIETRSGTTVQTREVLLQKKPPGPE